MNLKLVEQYYNSQEYFQRLKARAQIMNDVVNSDYHRARMILDVWSVNPIDFIETFLFLKLPNYNNQIKPFFLFDYQKRIIFKILEAEQDKRPHIILVDKPREMGLTWTIVAYFYWRWLFTPNWSGFILSRSENEVDKGETTPDGSIFGKFRWLLSNTPKCILPEGYQPKGKKGTSTDMQMRIFNPVMQSSLNGSTTNSNAGRSGRYSVTMVDEAFFIPNFLEVMRALESVSRVRILISSAKQGKQFEKFKKACEDNGDYINLTWKDHPWKDQEWFDDLQRRAEADPELLREAVVSYAVDKASQYYPEIDLAKLEEVIYDPGRPIYCSLDVGRGDLTVLIWWQYDGRNFKVLSCYSNKGSNTGGVGMAWFAPFLNPELKYDENLYKTQVQKDLLAKVRRWKKPSYWFGELDHFIKRMPTNQSTADVLLKFQIKLMYNRYAVKYEPRRQATAMILPLTIFNKNDDYVNELYDAMYNSRYAKVTAVASKDATQKPVHDLEIADYRSAFENFAINCPRLLRHQRTENRSDEVRDISSVLLKYLKI